MNVNKKSLSYQLFTFFDRNKEKGVSNICQYTRGIIAGILLTLFSIIMGAAILVILLDPILSTVAYLLTGMSFISFFHGTEIILLFVGFTIWLIIFSIIAGFVINDWYQNIKNKVEYSTNLNVLKTINTLGIFIEYIKSKHDKICRNITFIKG